MFSGLASTLITKASVSAVTMLTVGSGMAYAGALPAPLQSAAADVGAQVGITLPEPAAAPVYASPTDAEPVSGTGDGGTSEPASGGDSPQPQLEPDKPAVDPACRSA